MHSFQYASPDVPPDASAAVRAVHFTDTYLPRRDGIVTAVRTLMDALAVTGHPGLLVTPYHPAGPASEVGVQVPAIPTGIVDLRLALPSARQVESVARWRPDIVHVHTPGPVGALGVLTARRLGVPLVQTYHTDLHSYAKVHPWPTAVLRVTLQLYARWLSIRMPVPRNRGGVVDAYNTLLLGSADAVIVPTRSVLSRTRLHLPDERLFVVPAGVSATACPPGAGMALRERWALPRQDPVVLFVGRVHREKGVGLLAHAFRRVLDAHPSAWLVLVGAVYGKSWVRRRLSEAAVGDRTMLVGQQPPDVVAAAYAAADVLAFPSLTDTQGLVIQEAALAGLPTVMVDASLHAAGVLGDNVVLAAPTPATFGRAIGDLLADSRRAQELGAAARTRAGALTPAWYGERTLAVYRAAKQTLSAVGRP